MGIENLKICNGMASAIAWHSLCDVWKLSGSFASLNG